MAVLGSREFDVNSIDIASISLAGVAPVRSSFEDIAAPVSDTNECRCSIEGPDGYIDLLLKFETEQIAQQIKNLGDQPTEKGQVFVLTLTGVLSDGTPVEGTDCVVIVGNPAKNNNGKRVGQQ